MDYRENRGRKPSLIEAMEKERPMENKLIWPWIEGVLFVIVAIVWEGFICPFLKSADMSWGVPAPMIDTAVFVGIAGQWIGFGLLIWWAVKIIRGVIRRINS